MTHERRVLLFMLVTSGVAALVAWGWASSIRKLYPQLWQKGPLRALVWAWVGFGVGSSLLRAGAPMLGVPYGALAPLAWGASVGLMLMVASLPFLALGRGLAWFAGRPAAPVAPESPAVPEPRAPAAPAPTEAEPAWGLTRRELALTTARLIPAAGVGIAVAGLGEGMSSAVVHEVEMSFAELPRELEGLKILQYSDVHLGQFIDLAEIERLVRLGAETKPDLVVLTGDIADELRELPDALRMFASLRARLGTFASIGNHEYFRGFEAARKAYDGSEVPLLLESGTTLEVGGARLRLSGVDDPRFLGQQSAEFFERTVGRTLSGAPSDAFHVMMSHRPEGFVAAAAQGVHLTLSGHTHGAQLGFAGRSIFEPILSDKYLWGPYQKDGKRLYTSSGTGHWLPFRVGCPRELVVVKLVRGPSTAEASKRRFKVIG